MSNLPGEKMMFRVIPYASLSEAQLDGLVQMLVQAQAQASEEGEGIHVDGEVVYFASEGKMEFTRLVGGAYGVVEGDPASWTQAEREVSEVYEHFHKVTGAEVFYLATFGGFRVGFCNAGSLVELFRKAVSTIEPGGVTSEDEEMG